MTDIFQGLNSRQREAVEATEGRIRVVAGAGTGKTKALTHRYAYLVNVLGIDPANLLCLTFTNKAAAEMRSRIAAMVHSGDYNDFVCTLHGFCVKGNLPHRLSQILHRTGRGRQQSHCQAGHGRAWAQAHGKDGEAVPGRHRGRKSPQRLHTDVHATRQRGVRRDAPHLPARGLREPPDEKLRAGL